MRRPALALLGAVLAAAPASPSWSDSDAEAMRKMIADADAEGGEIPLEEIARGLSTKPTSPRG